MKVLLDTHILLWAISNDARLPEKARKVIENEENMLFVTHDSLISGYQEPCILFV